MRGYQYDQYDSCVFLLPDKLRGVEAYSSHWGSQIRATKVSVSLGVWQVGGSGDAEGPECVFEYCV